MRILALTTMVGLVWLTGQAFQIVVVPTPSMESTVMVGDHLLINRWAYRWKRISRGDIVSFYPPGRERTVYLKRVIGVGGDLLEFRDGVTFVNGVPLAEPYAQHLCEPGRERPLRIRVPEGELYVMGDNRDESEDSRNWGTFPERNVIGAPVMVVWSFAVPTSEWLNTSPAAVYLDHPVSHLRWSRFLRGLK